MTTVGPEAIDDFFLLIFVERCRLEDDGIAVHLDVSFSIIVNRLTYASVFGSRQTPF